MVKRTAREISVHDGQEHGVDLSTPQGRFFNPGHSIEVAWFLLHMCEVVPDAKASTVWEAFRHNWISRTLTPSLIICDNGSEFVGADFVNACGKEGIRVLHTAAGAPWQNGLTERINGALELARDILAVCYGAYISAEIGQRFVLSDWM